ncbi:MAG: hypothetical protein MHM6MM_003011 [Cercozoa sp. M6MM]
MSGVDLLGFGQDAFEFPDAADLSEDSGSDEDEDLEPALKKRRIEDEVDRSLSFAKLQDAVSLEDESDASDGGVKSADEFEVEDLLEVSDIEEEEEEKERADKNDRDREDHKEEEDDEVEREALRLRQALRSLSEEVDGPSEAERQQMRAESQTLARNAKRRRLEEEEEILIKHAEQQSGKLEPGALWVVVQFPKELARSLKIKNQGKITVKYREVCFVSVFCAFCSSRIHNLDRHNLWRICTIYCGEKSVGTT